MRSGGCGIVKSWSEGWTTRSEFTICEIGGSNRSAQTPGSSLGDAGIAAAPVSLDGKRVAPYTETSI